MSRPRLRVTHVAGALLAVHLVLGLSRLPGKVYGRRQDDIAAYREQGAASFLLERAHLGGTDALEWVLQNTPEDSVILWRWPADGAFEFSSALLAPRLVVDDRRVGSVATRFAERDIATGLIPSGERGQITLQGLGDGGLRLTVRQ